MTANHDLVEDIRVDWSRRARTFDLAVDHNIAPRLEVAAWAGLMAHLWADPVRVLERACTKGKPTNLCPRPDQHLLFSSAWPLRSGSAKACPAQPASRLDKAIASRPPLHRRDLMRDTL